MCVGRGGDIINLPNIHISNHLLSLSVCVCVCVFSVWGRDGLTFLNTMANVLE